MNTFQLQCFLAVANSLSFARAAEHLFYNELDRGDTLVSFLKLTQKVFPRADGA